MVNIEKIRELNQDPGFQIIVDLLRKSVRDREHTEIRNFYYTGIRKVTDALSLEQTVGYFRRLQETGLGMFVEGGRGKAPRFKWGFRLRTLTPLLEHPEEEGVGRLVRMEKFRTRGKRFESEAVLADDLKEAVDAIVVADMALPKASPRVQERPARARRTTPPQPSASAPLLLEGIPLTIADTKFQFAVPMRLTEAQANTICRFIRSLAS